MIGLIAKSIFNMKTKALFKKAFGDPRLNACFEKYQKDTADFKEELKSIGLTSSEDLRKALESDPKLAFMAKFA